MSRRDDLEAAGQLALDLAPKPTAETDRQRELEAMQAAVFD